MKYTQQTRRHNLRRNEQLTYQVVPYIEYIFMDLQLLEFSLTLQKDHITDLNLNLR